MRVGRASRTAQLNALFRAIEQGQPEDRRIVSDPLARAFLDRPLALANRLAALPILRSWVPRFIDWRWPGPRSSVVARTRFIDDAIEALLREPVEQFVVLGAGFDTRAYRLLQLERLAVFEVDHPDTQAAKLAALGRALGTPPKHVRFVPTDFHEKGLAGAISSAGYDASLRSLILWEGVTNYLTAAAVDAALRWCARAAPGSALIFTYVHRDILTRPQQFVGHEQLLASLERMSERFTFGLDPAELPGFLADRGLALESDVGCAEYRARTYGAAAQRMRGHEFYRVAIARVV